MHQYIEVRKYPITSNPSVVKRILVCSMPNKLETALNVNLNHEKYYTIIVRSENELKVIY